MTRTDKASTDRIIKVDKDATDKNWCVFRCDSKGNVDRIGELSELRREAAADAAQEIEWDRADRRVSPRLFANLSVWRSCGVDISK